MPKYKVLASKNQKKYNLIFSASTKEEAKQRVHLQGYSVLGIEEINLDSLKWNKIIFRAIDPDWKEKKWKVIWNDLFKVFLKLKEDLAYDIKELFFEQDKNLSQEEKQKELEKLQRKYELYKQINKQDKKEKKQDDKKQQEDIDSFYLKKELEESYKLLDFTLKKLSFLLQNENFNLIEFDKREKLKIINNELIKLKTSTNIAKIKKISELALEKIWELELFILEQTKNEELRKELQNTNKLLKKLWSGKHFVEKDKDPIYIIHSKIWSLKHVFRDFKNLFKKKKRVINKKSNFYISAILKINFFNKKLRENTIRILKNLIVFIYPFWKNRKKRMEILLERRYIKSNLILLKAKINQRNISYTKLVKWFSWILDFIYLFFKVLRKYLFLIIYFYSFLFLIIFIISYFNIFNYWWIIDNLNYNWLFYFLWFIFVYLAIYLSRWFYSLVFNIIIVWILFIFWVVNF